ncbi:hypothetical protein GQ42DRAFT_125486 [Ramicandelaber brevisporus]|nr:hypothetical protein GQ42DRAFT_125486 [Ramicandelaber brevisporus]
MDIDDDGAGHPSRTLDSIISTEQNTPPSGFDPSDATGGGGSGASGSNDNPVVREIPVYLSNTLTQHLRLFQFPVRESHLVFDPSSRPAVVRAKPKSKMFELDIPLDTGAALYNQDKGRDFGSGQIAMDDQPLNMQTLSSVNISAPTKYAVGIMSNGKLHLTLVDKIDQFRPGLGYIDARDSIDKLLSKRGTSALGEGDDMDEDGADEAGGAGKTVQLQMRAAERQEIVEARKASISYMRKELREEPWQLFRYNDEASEEAEMLYRGMFAGSEEVLQVAKPAKLIT